LNQAVDPVLEAFAFVQEIHPRYEDLDIQRHVNNIAVHAFHAEGCRRFLMQCAREVSADSFETPEPSWLDTRFLHIAQYPEPLQCGVRVLKAKNSLVLLHSALFQGGVCIGTQLQGMRFAQDPSGSVALQALRTTLQSQLGTSSPDTPISIADVESLVAPDAAAWPHQAFLTARFGDIDARGGTGALALLRFAEQARVPVLYAGAQHAGIDLDRGPVDALLANTRLRYLDRRAVCGRVALSVRPLRLGTTSLVLRSAVYDGEVCLAVNDSVMVFVHRESLRPVPMAQRVRDYFSPVS
jgi:acyl-CoA thioesterase FadM